MVYKMLNIQLSGTKANSRELSYAVRSLRQVTKKLIFKFTSHFVRGMTFKSYSAASSKLND